MDELPHASGLPPDHFGLARARRAAVRCRAACATSGGASFAASIALALVASLSIPRVALGASAPAGDAEFGPPGAPFVLRALGRCLEVNEPQLQVDGARVHLQRCDGAPHQAWRRERGRIVNVASGRCLDVHGPDAGFDGARVQTVSCSAAPNQLWQLAQGLLVARVDGRCLLAPDAPDSSPGSSPGWREGRRDGERERDRDGDRDSERRRRSAWAGTVHTGDCAGPHAVTWRAIALPPAAPPVTRPVAPAPDPAPAPRGRDVEAGPLFNQAEAERKCPTVCAPARWSGRWLTTVPGRMSVCGCVEQAATPPTQPAPGEPMADARFGELVRLLEGEAFPSSALQTLEMVARDHALDTAQVRRLFAIFPFTRDRLRVLEIALPRLVDRADAYRLLDAFAFDSEKAEVRRLLERAAAGGR